MDWRLPAPAALTALLLVTLVGSVSGQENSDPEMPDSFKEAMPLYAKGLGAFSRDVTTDSPEAQAFFNQGIQLMYAFTPENAARSFREAQLRDPNCAMCFWGEAWAWGPYMNGPMGPGSLPRAKGLAVDGRKPLPIEAPSRESRFGIAMLGGSTPRSRFSTSPRTWATTDPMVAYSTAGVGLCPVMAY